MATIILFNVALFRERFAAFTDPITYPTVVLDGYWATATCFVSDVDCGLLHGACREQALMLMTAHLAALATALSGGNTAGILTSATIDKVSVSLTPPPVRDQWEYWLNLTPYGAQLLAILTMRAVGGLYVGGRPERSAFRKVFGQF